MPRGLALALIISAVNNAKPALAAVQRGFHALARAGLRTAAVLRTAFRGLRSVVRGIASTATLAMRALAIPVTALTAIFVLSIKKAADLERAMADVATLVNTNAVNMGALTERVGELSVELGTSSTELARGLFQIISAGSNSADAMDILEISTKAATAGMTDTLTAADGLTTILNAYGLSAKHATKISDQLFVANKLGKTTFGEIAASIGRVVPLAAALGVKSEELFSAIAAVTKQGIPTQMVMTGLKAALSNVIRPTEDAIKTARRLGIDFSVTALRAKGFSQFLFDILRAAKGDKDVLTALFGSVEAVNTIMALTTNNAKEFRNALSEMKVAAGATEEAYKKIADTLSFQFKKLVVGISEIARKIGNLFLPAVKTMVTELGVLIKAMSKADFGKLWDSFISNTEEGRRIFEKFIDVAMNGLFDFSSTFIALMGNVVSIAFEPFLAQGKIMFERFGVLFHKTINVDVVNALLDLVIQALVVTSDIGKFFDQMALNIIDAGKRAALGLIAQFQKISSILKIVMPQLFLFGDPFEAMKTGIEEVTNLIKIPFTTHINGINEGLQLGVDIIKKQKDDLTTLEEGFNALFLELEKGGTRYDEIMGEANASIIDDIKKARAEAMKLIEGLKNTAQGMGEVVGEIGKAFPKQPLATPARAAFQDVVRTGRFMTPGDLLRMHAERMGGGGFANPGQQLSERAGRLKPGKIGSIFDEPDLRTARGRAEAKKAAKRLEEAIASKINEGAEAVESIKVGGAGTAKAASATGLTGPGAG